MYFVDPRRFKKYNFSSEAADIVSLLFIPSLNEARTIVLTSTSAPPANIEQKGDVPTALEGSANREGQSGDVF